MTKRTRKPDPTEARGAADPRVLVFACNWCSYAGADTAGVSRLQQSPHFRLLRVMCSGRVHPAHVLRAFARGADGVMVSGCHFGDCHYMFGNYRAAEQFERTRALVDLLGLEPERLRLEWISAAEGVRFAETMNEFVETVRRAGPSPIAPDMAQDGGAAPEDAPGILPALETASLPEADPFEGANLFVCLECGRCTAVCPVARYQRFSPRRLVTRTLSGGSRALAGDPSLWTCLTCYGCESVCPVRVDYGRFILAARAAVAASPARAAEDHGEPPAYAAAGAQAPAAPGAVASGAHPAPAPPEASGRPGAARPETAIPPAASPRPEENGITPCSHGGVFREISLMAARPGLRQRRLGWLAEGSRVEILEEGARGTSTDLFFAGCAPYFAAYFAGETGAGLNASLRAGVRLLNRVGIRPALLANERCCGYHLRLAGCVSDAERLEDAVAAQIAASGAKRVITYCPECLVALREALARRGVACTLAHLSQVLGAERQALGAPVKEAGSAGRVTYQDPCRLGRYLGVYDRPRQLLVEVAGVELAEMAHRAEGAICCGNTGWLNCNAATKRFQTARLDEAAATGSARLVTACPGCYLHLRCAQEGLPAGPAADLEIVDLWSVLDASSPAPGTPGGESSV
jgi:Fe-S oxidoreductase/coenzyme F420-reducing hydrogenase delta subunit